MARIDPEKLEEWIFQMDAPLPGSEQKISPLQAEAEGDSFMALMQMNRPG